MTRIEALTLVKEHLKTANTLIKHSIAVESGLRELAEYFEEDKEMWGLAGLLHDLDYEETKNDFSRHGIVTAEILANHKFSGINVDEILYAIKAHSGKVPPLTTLDWSLYAIDPLTGLIVASCLMHPEKKLEHVDTEFVLNRYNEKRFAAGANREQIKSCEKLGITLGEFIDLTLTGMQKIHTELEL